MTRILAVDALVVITIGLVMVISSSLSDSDGDGATRAGKKGGGGNSQQQLTQPYYVVKPGDNFTEIADRMGVPLQRLSELNPDLDTQLLQSGNCVNLKPEGCQELTQGG